MNRRRINSRADWPQLDPFSQLKKGGEKSLKEFEKINRICEHSKEIRCGNLKREIQYFYVLYVSIRVYARVS